MENLKPMNNITLESNRILLRPVTMEDAESMFHNWASDPNVTKYLPWDPHPDIDETKRIIEMWKRRYLEDPFFFHWVIFHKPNNEPVGTVTIFDIDQRFRYGEIGYCLSSLYWNQGIMTEAVRLVFDYAFEENHFEKIISKHLIENQASGKVMMHVGMKYIKTQKTNTCKPQHSGQISCYQITREDYNNIKRRKLVNE